MTETGKVVNKDGKTYEEINKDHIAFFGDLEHQMFVCKDNTIDIRTGVSQFAKITDKNGNSIKAKNIVVSEYKDKCYILGTDNRLYTLDSYESGISSKSEESEITKFEYIKARGSISIITSDGSTSSIGNVEFAYDVENLCYM